MKKMIVIGGSVLGVLVAVTAFLAMLNYKMTHRRYMVIQER